MRLRLLSLVLAATQRCSFLLSLLNAGRTCCWLVPGDECIQLFECRAQPGLDSAFFQGYVAWFAMLWHVSVRFAVCSNCSATLGTEANLLA